MKIIDPMLHLASSESIVNKMIAELRNVEIQEDRMRFRKNMEHLGMILAYEISKTFRYSPAEITTPLGVSEMDLPDERIVLATILRAGIPLHNGMLNVFNDADAAFVSSYRKHHKGGEFEINLEYITCPDLTGAQLILCDPMVATGSSVHSALDALLEYGNPKAIHVATAIASEDGIEHLQRTFKDIHLWIGDIDDELTAKSYIVPGLGDAGDLSFGPKLQE